MKNGHGEKSAASGAELKHSSVETRKIVPYSATAFMSNKIIIIITYSQCHFDLRQNCEHYSWLTGVRKE